MRPKLWRSFGAFQETAEGPIETEENQRGIEQYLLATQFYDYDQALVALNNMKKAGFKHAQIVLYSDGKRIVNWFNFELWILNDWIITIQNSAIQNSKLHKL